MKKYIVLVLVLLFAVQIFAQSANPRPPRTTWKKELDYIKNGTMTFTYKTLASPTLTGPTISGTATVSGATNYTGVNAAGGSANPWDYTGTLGAMNGSDDFTLFDINLTNVDHTGTGNVVKVLDIANITGDAQATETAISIGTGWDIGIATSSGVKVGAAGDVVTLVDTLCSPGGVAKWARFTVGGVSFVAVSVADTARIVD